MVYLTPFTTKTQASRFEKESVTLLRDHNNKLILSQMLHVLNIYLYICHKFEGNARTVPWKSSTILKIMVLSPNDKPLLSKIRWLEVGGFNLQGVGRFF